MLCHCLEQKENMPECWVMVVGDKRVGKSALIRRFAIGMFVEVSIYNPILKAI